MSIRKILLVDDDAVFVNSLSRKLRAEGFEVIVAQDGSGAVSAARACKPDLIVLDLFFPPDVGHGGGVSWDGFLILDWLRRTGDITDTPIIVATVGDPEQYAERAQKAGASGLFQKGSDICELVRLIHQFLDERARASVESVAPADVSQRNC